MIGRMPRNVLIVKLSAMGDVLQALDGLEALDLPAGQNRIVWAVKAGLEPLFAGVSSVAEVISVPKSLWHWHALRPRVGGQRFDITVDLQGLAKSHLLARFLGCREIVSGGTLESRDWLSPRFSARTLDWRAPTARAWYGGLIHWALAGRLPDPPIQRPRAQPPARGVKDVRRVLCAPGAAWPTKRLPLASWLKLLTGARAAFPGAALALLQGTGGEERAFAAALAQQAASQGLALLPPLSLEALKSEILSAQVYLGMDSGPGHWAARLGLETLLFYGPSLPAYYDRSASPPAHARGTCHLGVTFRTRCPNLRRCNSCSALESADAESAFAEFLAARFVP